MEDLTQINLEVKPFNEAEIEAQAASIFPGNLELQSSFILGVHLSIYKNNV